MSRHHNNILKFQKQGLNKFPFGKIMLWRGAERGKKALALHHEGRKKEKKEN